MRKMLLSAAFAIAASAALAQSTPAPRPASPPAATATAPATAISPPAVTTATPPAAPLAGANSFTMGQAKSRIEAAGYIDVTGLAKDKDGIWRGKASKGGTTVDVSLDYKGNVFGG